MNVNALFLGKRIFETDHLIVVQHPKPTYSVHYLILPRQQIAGLRKLEPASGFWQDVPVAIQELREKKLSTNAGFRVIINGGAYQDIPLLHLHFVSGDQHDQP